MKRTLSMKKTGTIVGLIRSSHYGYIQDDNGDEVFFHFTGVLHPLKNHLLREGHRVEFQTMTIPKGVKAIGIRVTDLDSIPQEV